MGTGRTLICVSAALVLTAGAATAETPKRGGILNFAVVAEPPNYDCHASQTFAVLHPVSPMYSYLVKYDSSQDGKIVGEGVYTYENVTHAEQVALAEARDKVENYSKIDWLTGLYNMRHFDSLAAQEMARAERYARPMSVLMLDSDHLKVGKVGLPPLFRESYSFKKFSRIFCPCGCSASKSSG